MDNIAKEIQEIIEYKTHFSLSIYDQERENQVIELNSLNIKNEGLKSYYKEFIKSIMDISKKYQEEISNGKK